MVSKLKKPRVSIIGLGFVGLSLAVTNAKKGFFTVAVDNQQGKIKSLNNGKPYFYEPLLTDFLHSSIKSKKIEFTKQTLLFLLLEHLL